MVSVTTKRWLDLAFGIVVIILNIIEIVCLVRLKRKRKNYEVFLLSLSIADMLFGLANCIISIVQLADTSNAEAIEVNHTIYFFFVLTSICHLSWIALDRLWAVGRPIRHKMFVTTRKINILLMFTWFVTVTLAVTLKLVDEYTENFKPAKKKIAVNNTTANATGNSNSNTKSLFDKEVDDFRVLMQTTLSSFIVVADVLFVVCYSLITYILKRNSKKVLSSASKDNSILVTCFVIATSFIAFTLPFAISVFVQKSANVYVNLLLVSNSGVNCVVYFLRNYRRTTKEEKTSSNAIAVTPLATRANTKIKPNIELKTNNNLTVSNY